MKFVKGCVINIRGFLLSAHHNLLHFLQTSFFWKFLFLVVDKLEGLIVGLDSGSVYLFTPDSWFSWSGAIPVSINILPSSSRCLIAISRVHRFPQFRFTETVLLYLRFSCGWFAISLRKNNLPTFFFSKQFFACADKVINFPLFLLTVWRVRGMFKTRPCFFFLYCLFASISI